MKVLEKVTEIFERLSIYFNNKRQKRKMKELLKLANKVIQVREFNKKLYICFDNCPIIEQSMINSSLEDAVGQIRDYFVSYNYNDK